MTDPEPALVEGLNPAQRDAVTTVEGPVLVVAGARGHYNGAVRAYDQARQVFPTNILANMFGFEDREYFEVETVDIREAPSVDFGE